LATLIAVALHEFDELSFLRPSVAHYNRSAYCAHANWCWCPTSWNGMCCLKN